MIKSTTTSFTVTIIFLSLMSNVQHWSTYATKEVLNPNTLYDDKIHHLTKRMDLQVCLGQFDVHKNTIIRTGESQAIGGKYLQGLELDTMEECQRLCCETESCDVYIFESKKDGYCYLFECGTPENFHCKFTRHANYTSAVLTPVIRSNIEVTTQHPMVAHKTSSAISQQEWELSNLKIKPEVRTGKTGEVGLAGMNNLPANTNAKKSLASSDVESNTKVNSTVQCGRFQFACHSGECIAVYNACDGIPQCEDGSDEGPECSGANNNNNVATNTKSSSDGNSNKISSSPQMTQYQQSQSFMQQSAQQQLQNMQQIQPSHQTQNAGVIPSIPVVNNREDPTVWETRKIVSGTPINVNVNADLQNMSPVSSSGSGVAAADGFTAYMNSRQSATHGIYAPAATSDVNIPLGGGNSGSSTIEQSGLYVQQHGLTGGVQDPNGLYIQQQQQQQQHIMLPPPPPPPPAPLNSNWQQQAILNQQKQQQQNLAISQQQQQVPLPQGSQYAMQNDGTVAQQQQSQPVASIMMKQPTQQQQPQQQSAQLSVPSLSQQQLQQLAETKSSAAGSHSPSSSLTQTVVKSDDSDEYEDSEEKSTEPPKKHKHRKGKSKSKDLDKMPEPNEDPSAAATGQQQQSQTSAAKAATNSLKTIKTAVSPVHEQYEIIHQNMALEFRDHDGQSERPGGAVLSLTLGLLITAALAILIGCRMRTVGRRARRMGGKTPYSHEADFLVNGMYL
ncbi:uncharacterized protein [Musca autumnalis]|uniref:uncharacterized protein n=1 Tax=Musca autumnalis TaxID=221902 RepID=UPI003CE6F094